jgi:hypothetical protein
MLLAPIGCNNEDDVDGSNLPDVSSGNKRIAVIDLGNAASRTPFVHRLLSRLDYGSEVTDSTGMIFIGDAHLITPAQMEAVKRAYNNGAFVAMLAPVHSEHSIFTDQLEHDVAVASDLSSTDEFCDLVVFDKNAHTLFIHDLGKDVTIHTSEENWQSSTYTNVIPSDHNYEAPSNEKTTHEDKAILPGTKAFSLELSDEILDALSNRVIDFVDEFSDILSVKLSTAATKAQSVANAQHVYKTWVAHFDFGRNPTSQLVNENFTITPVYSYDEDRDFYMVEHEVQMMNASLDYRQEEMWMQDDGYEWLTAYNFSRGIYSEAFFSLEDNDVVRTIQTSPQTTQGSSQFSTGFAINVGGNIGFSGSAVTGGFSGGVTISNSHTTSIPDVAVQNLCMDQGRQYYVKWTYSIASPVGHGNWYYPSVASWRFDQAPAIARSTAVYNNSWVWTVSNPKSHNNGQYGMRLQSKAVAGWKRAYQNFWGICWENEIEHWALGPWFDISFVQPNRN